MKQNIIIAVAAIAIFVFYTILVYEKGVSDEGSRRDLIISNAETEALKSAREKESILTAKIEALTKKARENENIYNATIDAANNAHNSMLEQANIYAAKADQCSPTPSRSSPKPSCVLLAKLFGEADARAGELAKAADEAIAAGNSCVAMYEEVKRQR